MGLFGGGKKSGASPSRRSRAPGPRKTARVEPHFEAPVAPKRPTVERKAAPRAPKPPKPPKAPRQPLPWARWGLKLMPGLAVGLVAALLLSGWMLLDYVGSVPVSRVAFAGNLKHVDRDELVARVQPLLAGEGFMTVDLSELRQALLELPWVAEVSIQRRWPDELAIAVTEQEAIARWGEDGLLNRRGQVFRPQPLGEVATLPALFGPDNLSAEVVAHYAELSGLLAEQRLMLASLGSDQRGSWRAELQGGVVLRLGTGDVLKKVRRFLRIYRDQLGGQFERVAYVDLRYSNGLAVGWKQHRAEPVTRAGT